jgi:hypothetical protein
MALANVGADDIDGVSRRKLSKTGIILISLSGVYQYVEVMLREDNA